MPDPRPRPELDTRVLLDWLEGRTDPERSDEIAVLVASADTETRRLVDWLRSFRTAARSLPVEPPPPLVSQRLRRAFAKRNDTLPPTRIVTVALVEDSRDTAQLAGVRGAPDLGSPSVQLRYEADGVEVYLDVVADRTDRTIRGQVVDPADSPSVFEAICHGPTGTTSSIAGDELGGFEVGSVHRDSHLIVLTNDELVVEVPLDLRDDGALR